MSFLQRLLMVCIHTGLVSSSGNYGISAHCYCYCKNVKFILEVLDAALYIILCLPHTDNCPPVNLDSLLVQLRPQVGPKWYQFGEAAGIANYALDKFAKQCHPEECIVELFDYWLRNSAENPTWRDIAKILKKIGLIKLGLEIESVCTTGINLVIAGIVSSVIYLFTYRNTTS